MKPLTYIAVGAVLSLGACSSSSGVPAPSRSAAGTGSTSASPAASAPTTSARTASAPTDVGVARCGVSGGATTHSFDLRVATSTLPAAWAGNGADVAVLLHQTDGDGACGWFPAAGMMADSGVRVIAFDLCGYGQASCPAAAPKPAQQVRAAVSWARAHGARRVTVVGASMGGSIALGTAASVAPNAVVDLSGPMTWPDVSDSAAAARALHVPLLGAASPGDPDSDPAALRRAVDSSPGTHDFVSVPDGHGVTMLTSYSNGKESPTPLLQKVIRWVKGKYA